MMEPKTGEVIEINKKRIQSIALNEEKGELHIKYISSDFRLGNCTLVLKVEIVKHHKEYLTNGR